MNYIPPIRQGEENRLYTPQNTEEDYLQPIHNSAVQSLARHNFRTVHQLSRHYIHTRGRLISKLWHSESELWKFLNILHLEVDVVGRWKLAASYYDTTRKIILPINYSLAKLRLTPSHLL